MHPGLRLIMICGCCVVYALQPRAQENTKYSQFWNEFAFNKTLKGKWSLELKLGQSWTSSPYHSSMFSYNSQLYIEGWVHFYLNARWKFSYLYAYYFNRYVPEIKQKELPELRNALQAIYYFHKVGYTLNAKMRIEDRHIRNDSNLYEASNRIRTELKLLYPINGKRIRKGVVYGIGSEELFFKTQTRLTGDEFFDRNRVTLGFGYSVTDDFQIETSYVNDYLPRKSGDEIYHVLQINFSFNNVIDNVKKKVFHH